MSIEEFKDKLRKSKTAVSFEDTMTVIESHYDVTPTAFVNGNLENKAGENSGSCKVFAFAKLEGLTKTETLACFGAYYYNDVLKNPEGNGHQNIRNFMETGFKGLTFTGDVLRKK